MPLFDLVMVEEAPGVDEQALILLPLRGQPVRGSRFDEQEGASRAAPIPPNRRPNSPPGSMSPICSRDGASTKTARESLTGLRP